MAGEHGGVYLLCWAHRLGLKIAFMDNDGNSIGGQSDTKPSSLRSRGNTDFSNHTWVPVPETGMALWFLANF